MALTIAVGSNAQGSTTAKKETKATTTKAEAKPADKGTQPKAAAEKKAEAKPADKKGEAKPTEKKSAEKKPADGRTKTGDKINKTMKGPNGETVYTGEKGGNYYLGKDDKKMYMKK